MNNSVRKITDGAMMVALIGLFLFINRQLAGLLDLYAAWLVPLPMVMYAVKYGWKSALIPFVSVIFLSFIIAGPQIWFYVITACVCGVVYGQGVKSGWNNLRLMLTTMIFTILSNLITTVLFASFFGYDIAMEISEMGKMMTQMSENFNVQLPASLDITGFLKMIFVLSAVLTGVMEGIIVHLLSNFMLKRMKIKVAPPKPLSEIMIPKALAYVCFLLFIASNFTSRLATLPSWATELILIGGVLGALVLVFFGYICCLVYGAVRYHKNVALFVILITFLMLPIMLPLLAIVGFLYVTTDMREKILGR